MLKIQSLSVAYGGLVALNDVSLEVNRGEFVAVVGPNGAGKTTLFKTLSGTVKPRAGQITYDGQDLLAVPPARRPHLGIAHVPEGRQVFPSLSVFDNLQVGALTPKGKSNWSENLKLIYDLFPILKERSTQLGGMLSGGEQQMLAIGRGLASEPQLLMLDEPSMGLAPTVADSIFETIERIRREKDITILLVEQRVAEALDSCDRGYVLETGKITLSGTHDTLMSDDRVKKAYLGM